MKQLPAKARAASFMLALLLLLSLAPAAMAEKPQYLTYERSTPHNPQNEKGEPIGPRHYIYDSRVEDDMRAVLADWGLHLMLPTWLPEGFQHVDTHIYGADTDAETGRQRVENKDPDETIKRDYDTLERWTLASNAMKQAESIMLYYGHEDGRTLTMRIWPLRTTDPFIEHQIREDPSEALENGLIVIQQDSNGMASYAGIPKDAYENPNTHMFWYYLLYGSEELQDTLPRVLEGLK